jgi:membrane protease YdiL (CAAX protease family)
MEKKQILHKKIGIFLLLTFIFSSVFYIFMVSTGSARKIGGFWMWSPGIAAILTKVMFRENLKSIGWQIGDRKYLFLGLGIPLLYALLIYGTVWISGLGRFTPQPVNKVLLYSTVGLFIACLTALGEEIGWRGYLIPELNKLTSFTNASLITGIIWALWHYPAIIFADYKSAAPLIVQLILITITIISFSFFTAWLRVKSNSIWPVVLWHGGHNLFIQQIFLDLTADTGITEYFIDDFGVGVTLAALTLGIVFWRQRKELPDLEKIDM